MVLETRLRRLALFAISTGSPDVKAPCEPMKGTVHIRAEMGVKDFGLNPTIG